MFDNLCHPGITKLSQIGEIGGWLLQEYRGMLTLYTGENNIPVGFHQMMSNLSVEVDIPPMRCVIYTFTG
jgi:hypothetical protein